MNSFDKWWTEKQQFVIGDTCYEWSKTAWSAALEMARLECIGELPFNPPDGMSLWGAFKDAKTKCAAAIQRLGEREAG